MKKYKKLFNTSSYKLKNQGISMVIKLKFSFIYIAKKIVYK